MSNSMIAGLQSELAAKQKKVAACESALEQVTKKATAALDKAKAELNAYRVKIAEALGLPVPGKYGPGAVSARRKKIRELLAQGVKGADAIAASLDMPVPLVEMDLAKILGGAKSRAVEPRSRAEDEPVSPASPPSSSPPWPHSRPSPPSPPPATVPPLLALRLA